MRKPIDMGKIEALRKYMLLSVSDMAELLGVTRVTYYHWVSGKHIRATNADKLRNLVMRLAHVVRSEGWPTDAHKQTPQADRLKKLKELIEV